MFNEVNKMFGRDFIVAYVLPSLALLVANGFLLEAYDLRPAWLKIDPNDALKDTTLIALLLLVSAFALNAFNRPIFRAMEGYWPDKLRRKLSFFYRSRWRHNQAVLNGLIDLRKAHKAAGTQLPEEDRLALANLWQKMVSQYPHSEDLVLPSAFGNTVIAFEDYPREMYGAESINLWPRLQAVMSKDFAAYLSSMRAATDLWVSLWFLNIVFLVECIFLPRYPTQPFPWFFVLASVSVWVFVCWRGRLAAAQWGEGVKAAFDIYLPQLQSTLGFKRSATLEEEHKFWTTYSQAILYRHRKSLASLDSHRTPPEPSKAGGSGGDDQD